MTATRSIALVPSQAAAPVALESVLVARARGGDPQAFRALFDRHAPSIRRFLRDLLGDAEAADEAAQETFVRAFSSLSSAKNSDRLAPWLFGIARHVFHEQLRARRRRMLAAGDEAPEIADAAPSPEAVLMHREADQLLARALADLSEERRAALLLRIDHGLDYEEIREVTGWSLAKVKNEIHRARLELRARLSKYVGGA
jgi:RNA polymerase sigma-70 factor (ECF subfamily)